MAFEVLGQSKDWVAIMKPSGFHVHPPEDRFHRVPREMIVLHQLRDQLGSYVYPVHRLDAATSGVLLMALSKDSASFLAQKFQSRDVRKVYHAVVRGWAADEARIDCPLELDSTGDWAESLTHYRRLAKIEINEPVGRRHSTARYSLVEAVPFTGRYHQIRRHMNRVAHPILGDATHGDSHHNRFFREKMGIAGLCLKAHRLSLTAMDGEEISIEAPDNDAWLRIRDLFQKNGIKD